MNLRGTAFVKIVPQNTEKTGCRPGQLVKTFLRPYVQGRAGPILIVTGEVRCNGRGTPVTANDQLHREFLVRLPR